MTMFSSMFFKWCLLFTAIVSLFFAIVENSFFAIIVFLLVGLLCGAWKPYFAYGRKKAS
jgi:type IV secretory pathway TrbL component